MKWWVTLSLFCTYLTAYSQHRLPELTKTDTVYMVGGDSLFLVRTFLERCDSPTDTFQFIYAFKACIGWDILDSVLLVKTDQGFEGFLKSRTYPLKEGYPVYRPLKLSAKQFQAFHRLELNCRLIHRGGNASASQYFMFLSGSTGVGFVDDGCWEKTYPAIRRKLLGLP